MNNILERLFHLKELQTNTRKEFVAGTTTFMTMAYILVVNPAILSATGMDSGALFTATAISACLGCLLIGLLANIPIALAPGLGINSFFAYTVVLTMGYSVETALTAVLLSGVIFLLISIFRIREKLLNVIPYSLKVSISVGIGLFIALVGLYNSGVITQGAATLTIMGDIKKPEVYLTLLSVIFTGVLLIRNVRGALLIGIIITTILGLLLGVTHIPDDFSLFKMPPSIEPIFFHFDFSEIFSLDMLFIIFVIFFMDFFDTAGTFYAVCYKANLLDETGEPINIKRAFIADSLSTITGSMLGMSSVTSFMESTAGVAEGGRTGLTSIFSSLWFIVVLFAFPIFQIVPVAATSAVLIIVGLFMCSMITKINFDNYKESLPAFITMIMIPFTYSIADGIMYGFLAHTLILILTGDFKSVNKWLLILVALFMLKILFT